MSEYIVSARKYRPQNFDAVVGQEALTTTLKNSVKSGKIAHAYLFCGPRGVGKTTCARIFAKAINCLNPTENGEACNECESCKSFDEGRSYNIFEYDAASNNGVNEIKTMMEQTRIPPQVGKYKVFIIDEVHMLSKDAFNAFLKTLEEPPSHVIFILATTEKNKILPTILSRCQIYDFERMSVQNIINHLKGVAEKENITFEEKALSVIAEKADGGMRDALSIFDQAASFCQGNITYKKVIEDLNVLDEDNYFSFVDLALTNKVSEAMVLLNSLLSKGFDGNNLIVGLASHIRNVLMAKDSQTIKLLETSENQAKRYQEQAQKCPTPFLYTALKILNQCDLSYNSSSNKRLLVELTIIEVAQITQKDDDAPSAGRSPKRLKSLFKKLLFNQPKAVQQVTVADGTQTSAAPTSNAAGTNIPQQAKSQLNISPRNTAGKTTGNGSPRQRLKLSSIGNTFANLKNANDTNGNGANAANEIGNQDETNAFTDSELQLQWRLMCNRMPKQMVGIASRMRNMTPAITDYPNIEVAVDNQILLDQMKNIQERIKATLAKTLHNGNINLKLRLADETEIVKTLSKNDILELMKKESEPLTLLCEKFDLELS